MANQVLFQLIKGKLRHLQKLLKYFNGTTTSAFNVLLSAGVLLIFVLYLKDLLVLLFILLLLASLFLLAASFIL